jgi:hypothetical protein
VTRHIATYPDASYVETAVNTGPLSTLPPWWTDISARALGPWDAHLGIQYELDRFEAGELHPVLDNRDGGLDPSNASGPLAPNLKPYRRLRIRQRWNPNELSADQATAGESSAQLGAIPVGMSVVNDFGYPLSIVASGSAYQGGQVYQAVLPTGATQFATVLMVAAVHVVPGRPYSFQAQARISAGNSVSTNAAIIWYDASGNILSTSAGTATTLTSGSATWVTLSASATAAPAGAYSAALKVQIASGTLTGSTTWQLDGLQFEASPVASPWQMPGTLGANLLPQMIAGGLTLLDPTKDSASNYFQTSGPIASTFTRVTGLTAAPTGHTTAVAWTVTAAGAGGASTLNDSVNNAVAAGPAQDCVQVVAGQTYTASRYLSRASSADATVQVTQQITWYDATGAAIFVASSSNAIVPVGSWVRATATLTAPAGAVWGRGSIAVSNAPSATNTIYSTALQFEQAGSASTWVDPGLTTYAFTGYFEQLPQVWKLSGTWGELDALGVDALAGLAQYQVDQPLVEEILALGPTFLYTLRDPAGSSSCTDQTGNRGPAPVENSPAGAGSLTFGNSVTATSSSGLMQGTAGPVATFANNPNGFGSPAQEAETYVSIHKTTVTPGPPQTGGWTRIIHFRSSTAPTSGQAYALWEALPQTALIASNGSFFDFGIYTSGFAHMSVEGASGPFAAYDGSTNLCDGNWHQMAMSCDTSGHIAFYVDGSAVAVTSGSSPITLPISSITSDVLGASVQLGAQYFRSGHVGDLACAAEFPAVLTAAQITNLYNSFRSASSGESSGARVKRLLSWVGWTGATAIDNGSTTSMGPATDLTGTSALDGLNTISETEGGWAYASTSGAIVFKGRSALYNSSPAYVFGEHTSLGEWPYEDVALPTDPILTFNIVPVAQYSTGQVALAQDAASQSDFFPRTMPQRTVNSTSFAEAQSAASYLLGRHKTPAMRCSQLLLRTSSVPGLARVAAQLDIGTRIRVFKRPPGRASGIQFDGFVQRIERAVDPTNGGDAYTLVEAFGADLATYWVLGALHTTLHSQAASGQNQATINALPDSAVNALASSLPQGYQLTFDPGTPIAETLTLSPTGIPSTTPGYSTATLTFTTNFAFTHAANAVVCEALPTGYTDPTTWDASSVLGAASTTVLSGGGAGTNAVTVGPLADGATNPLGSDWNVGDLLWISPGTPSFEGYNLLHPNVSTAGEGAIPLAAGSTVAGTGAFYGTPTITASASAWQGSQVWQTAVGASASTGHTLFFLPKIPITASLPYTWSTYVRSATTGANPSVELLVTWFDANSNSLGSITSSQTALTGSPTAAWTRLTLSGTAPAGAVWAEVAIFLEGTTPTSAWNFQYDGLQFEQAGAASTYCTTPQVKSVATSVAGYSSVQITLNSNLINSHSRGDTVCDPLPAGLTSPTQIAATTRIAY